MQHATNMNRNLKLLTNSIYSGNACFLIGNGINRYNEEKNSTSWERLLLEIHNQFSIKTRNFIPTGIALTEFYDILDLQTEGKLKKSLQDQFADKLEWNPKPHHKVIIERIQELNSPILTTNFDFVLEKVLNCEMYRHRINGLRALTDFYPWDTYFSNYERDDPFNQFSIWHMHGQVNYKRSIKLGLNQYLLMVERAKNHFPDKNLETKLSRYQTWIRLFFEKDLVIFGLGLDEQEVFIRWLLLQRARYYKRHPELNNNIFYINHQKSSAATNGKRFFLKSVGCTFVEFIDDYDGFYKGFWNQI